MDPWFDWTVMGWRPADRGPAPKGLQNSAQGFNPGNRPAKATRPHKEHGGITRDAAAGMSRELAAMVGLMRELE